MNDLSIKSVSLKGNLSDPRCTLSYSLGNDSKNSIFQLCIKDIAFENKSNNNISSLAQVKCNLVKDLRQFDYSTQSFLPTIASVLFKVTPTEKKITYFEKTWFLVNSQDDVIKISFTNPSTELPLNENCDVFVTVLLKQLK
jgi:hypothetical protein